MVQTHLKGLIKAVSIVATAVIITQNLAADTSPPPLAKIKMAAEAGDPIAQDQLGDRLRSNSREAEIWYRKAAAKGVVNSQCELGIICLNRAYLPGPKSDEKVRYGKEAIQWLTLAANQNSKRAQVALGTALRDGKITKQDYVEAYKWFSLASGNGLLDREGTKAQMLRDSIILRMSSAQLNEGQRRVASFAPRRPTSKEMPPPSAVHGLKLQGISGPPNRRLAIINNRTFEQGEEGQINVSGNPVQLQCIEIRERSVFVTVMGSPGVHELTLASD